VIVLLESQGKHIEDCEGECEVDTGRRLGADYVVSGELLRIGTSFKLDLRLHETREGQLLRVAAASGQHGRRARRERGRGDRRIARAAEIASAHACLQHRLVLVQRFEVVRRLGAGGLAGGLSGARISSAGRRSRSRPCTIT